MDAIIKECNNFRLCVQAVPDSNPRKSEMFINGEPQPFHLVKSEFQPPKNAPTPNNVVFIPLDIFDALFDNELAEEHERTEDNYKEVTSTFHFNFYINIISSFPAHLECIPLHQRS